MKRIGLLCVAFAYLFLALSLPVKADGITVSAQSAVLLDVETGEVLFEKNADTLRAMASTTKLMTALVAAEYGDWSQKITVGAEAVAVEGSSLGLRVGDTLTLRDAVCGMLLCSGNDAANAVALALAPTLTDFADKMNQKAKVLGMTRTTFVTPSGLDAPQHLSTARDMALLGSAVLQEPTLAEICRQKSAPILIGGRRVTVSNHNRLLSLYPYAVGLKTGFTKKAGRCLVSAAVRDGRRLVAVTLQAPNDWDDHTRLFEYGFTEWQAAAFPTVKLPRLKVSNGVLSETPLRQIEPKQMLFPASQTQEITAVIHLPPFMLAPIAEGTVVGRVDYRVNGTVLQSCEIQAAQAVAVLPPPSAWRCFGMYIQRLWQGLFVC